MFQNIDIFDTIIFNIDFFFDVSIDVNIDVLKILRIPNLRKLKLKTCLQVNISLYPEMLFYKLLETCLECSLVIKKLNSYTKGSMLCVKIVCECGNKRT
jgi:hypothetical protein